MMNTARPVSRRNHNSVFNIGAGFVQPIYALTSDAFATVQHEVPWGGLDLPSTSNWPNGWDRDRSEFREETVSSLNFGAIPPGHMQSGPLTVTINNPGIGTWVPEIRYNDHLRDHSGVSLNLISS